MQGIVYIFTESFVHCAAFTFAETIGFGSITGFLGETWQTFLSLVKAIFLFEYLFRLVGEQNSSCQYTLERR